MKSLQNHDLRLSPYSHEHAKRAAAPNIEKTLPVSAISINASETKLNELFQSWHV